VPGKIRTWAAPKELGKCYKEAHEPQEGRRGLGQELAVIMHDIWKDGTEFEPREA
jgi:hypothetical protein